MIPVQHIHPMLVHFPIVLILLLAAFDSISVLQGKNIIGRTTAGNISLALALLTAVSAIATFAFGGMALNVAESGGFHSDVAEIHESLGTAVAIAASVYGVLRLALWWRNPRLPAAANFIFPLTAIAGSALVAVTASYGGQLVYELGVNVAKIAMN